MTPSSPARSVRPSAVPFPRLLSALFACAAFAVMPGCFSSDTAPGGPAATRIQVLNETPSPHRIVVDPGQTPPAACVVVVNQPPPPTKKEEKPKRPAKGSVWLDGSWRYYSGHYVWEPGHWELPPRPHAVYEQPRWLVRHGNHMFVEGYWHF